jgi:hypothetical protein
LTKQMEIIIQNNTKCNGKPRNPYSNMSQMYFGVGRRTRWVKTLQNVYRKHRGPKVTSLVARSSRAADCAQHCVGFADDARIRGVCQSGPSTHVDGPLSPQLTRQLFLLIASNFVARRTRGNAIAPCAVTCNEQ